MRRLFIFILMFLSTAIYAQRGPGGVTVDNDTQKNCRLWLDAGDLTNLADGDPVFVWHDKSISLVDDSAFWDPADASKYLQPTYRDALSAGINGKPVVSYENGGMLKIGTWPDTEASPDLNTNTNGYQTTYEQSIFVAFRTGNDVIARQDIWEEGGYNKGFKIYIRDGAVFIAVYDNQVNQEDPGSPKVPKFGFAYKKMAVQPNTTYVLSYIYNVPTNNELITNNSNPNESLFTGMTGTLNGNPFPSLMEFGCCEAEGIGGVGPHPDPIGLGGHNRTSYDEDGPMNSSSGNTGTRLFQGRLAELCYYAYALDDAERIIVENYLAAKYFANVIQNDIYEYEAAYGDGVIGIGKQRAGVQHNISQGDNLFEISVADMAQAFPQISPQYLSVGHNNNQLAWSNQNTPDSASIQRLRRIWRWDRYGTIPVNKEVKIKLYPQDIAKLPPLPAGYTKYGILKEHTSSYLPNFNQDNSSVIELYPTTTLNGGIPEILYYEAKVNIEDGEFFTLCAIRSTAQFELYSDYAIEGDPAPASFPTSVKLKLNYKPAPGPGSTVGFHFLDGSAEDGTDYYSPAQNTVTFGSSATETNITFNIINNTTATPPPTKNLKIILDPATSNIFIGARDTLDFSIYDDDPEPKITFALSDSTISETAGIGRIQVRVLGTTTTPSKVRIIRPQLAIAGTATYNLDYELPDADGWYNYQSTKRAKTLVIPAGTNKTAYAYFTILADDLDEYDETIHFNLEAIEGAGVDETYSILHHTIFIADANEEPTVAFTSSSSEGYEAMNNPRLYVELNTPSAKQVIVPYSYIGGDAIPSPLPNSDFSGPSNDTLVFEPGETEKYIELIVYSDEQIENDETIIFQLDPNPTHAVLGTPFQHTYTIKDYTGFEWQGVAGIGKFQDNTFWMVPDGATSGANIPNGSPHTSINIFQNVSSQTPSVTTAAGGLNNHQLVVFSGNQYLKIGGTGKEEGQFPLINTGGQYDRKSIFFVFSPSDVTSGNPQVIYEQGGGGNGFSIYQIKKKLYFNMYAVKEEPFSPWGLEGNGTDQNNSLGQAYIESTINLEAGHYYIVSCHYSRNMGYTSENEPPLAGMHMYINGVLQGSYTTDSDGNRGVGRLYKHTGYTSIGAMWYQGRIHNKLNRGPSGSSDLDYYFKGKLGEFLYFNEPTMNEARVRILHNYFSSRYDIQLDGGTQDFNLNYADNTTSTRPDFNHQMAGIGKEGSAVHGISQGLSNQQGFSELKIMNPVFTQNPAFLNWGNNGEKLTTTWPYSNSYLPAGINERSGKTWRFSANPAGGISKVDIYLKFSSAQNADAFQGDAQLLKLLVNTSGDPNDFSSATVYEAQLNNGNVAEFDAIPVTDGMYIALANSSSIIPLPIELLGFTAKLNTDFVDLNWATASEINNEYFNIERAGPDLKWKEIAQVAGAGNSNSTRYYNAKDRNPLSGISYYRLKQVDFDGKYKYSEVVSVMNSHLTNDEQVIIYPNPNKDGALWLRIPSAVSDFSTTVTIYDLTGKVHMQTRLRLHESISELNIENINPGVYIIQIHSDALDESRKLIRY